MCAGRVPGGYGRPRHVLIALLPLLFLFLCEAEPHVGGVGGSATGAVALRCVHAAKRRFTAKKIPANVTVAPTAVSTSTASLPTVTPSSTATIGMTIPT